MSDNEHLDLKVQHGRCKKQQQYTTILLTNNGVYLNPPSPWDPHPPCSLIDEIY